MSQTRKAPTPIRTAPSSAPLESMVAKQQAHIDELVARNRTLEHTINKLRAETASEKQQYENALVEANKLWKIERSEWQDGCDTLQRLWRIAHYRTLVELEKARAATLNVKEELRMEKIARLQRDFQIAMFQKKESESEYRISCLEDELVAARLGSDELTERMKQEAGEVSTKYANLKKVLQQKDEEFDGLSEEKNQLEKTLQGLRKEHTALVSSSTSNATALERAHLQLDGVKASHTELQEKHTELERTNADLLRQLDKWVNLENREGGEIDDLRKSKVELEVRIAELEEVENNAKEREARFKAKLQKYKDSLAEHTEALTERDNDLDERVAEVEELKKQLASLEKALEDEKAKASSADKQPKQLAEVTALKKELADMKKELKKSRSLLDAEKAKLAVAKQPQASSSKPSGSDTVEEDTEVAAFLDKSSSPAPTPPAPRAKGKPKPRPAYKNNQVRPESPKVTNNDKDDSGIEYLDGPSITQSIVVEDDNEIEEIEAPVAPTKKAKAKATEAQVPAKPRGRPKKQKAPPPEDDDEVQVLDNTASVRKGKRKASDADEEENSVEDNEKPKKRAKPTAEPKKAPPKSTTKAKAKAKEVPPDKDLESDGEVGIPKKKKAKRKINIFPSSQTPVSFNWDLAPSGADGSKINIPTELSPVKDGGEAAPRRSLLGGRLNSALGGLAGRR